MEAPGRFLLVFAALTAAALCGVGALNVVVDPYDLYRVVRLPGRPERPEQIFHDRLYKAHLARRARGDAVILGTSRAQVGIDPHSAAFAGKAARPVNLALSDGSPAEALRYLQHAHATSPVKLVVFGLDFLSFDVMAPPNVEFLDARLAVDADGDLQPLSGMVDWPSTLLSIDALRASARTLKRGGEPSYFHDGGQRNTFFMEARLVEQGGVRGNMLHSERDYLESFSCYQGAFDGGTSPPLRALRDTLRFAAAHDIEVHLFFSPSHVRSQLVVEATGLWPALEEWRRAVVALVATEGGARAHLWDFAAATPFTTEPVPPAGDATARLRFHWESSHYKGALGDLVLSRMLGTAPPEADGFGTALTAVNIEGVLRAAREGLAAYRAAHPDERAEDIEALAAEVVPQTRSARRCAAPFQARPLVVAEEVVR